MAALTTLNITEKNANNSLSVTVKVNVTKEGVFTTTLSKEDVDKIHSYGIKLPTNRLGIANPFVPNTNNKTRRFMGMGGRMMEAILNDGRKIISNDWWHQGKIPEEFKDLIPDNAKWVKMS